MEENEINYRNLRKIQQMEKNSPVLTSLQSDFYNSFADYLENLNKRLKEEESSQKKILLKDEIKNTEKIAINIYEHREKKILLAAVSKARGGNPDLKNMIEVEKNIFDKVLEIMLNSRKNLIENEKPNKVEPEKTKKENVENNENSNPIVKVNKDIPEFIGTDGKKYNLSKNDVISLPENMSNMLEKRGAINKID